MTQLEAEAALIEQARVKAKEFGVEFATLGTRQMEVKVFPYFYDLDKADQDIVRAAALREASHRDGDPNQAQL